MTEPIPGPKSYAIIGNLFDLRHDEGSLKAVTQLADIYGDVFRIKIAGKRQILVCSAELLMQFTADESQFEKLPPPAITRSSGPQGLFTSRSDDPDWAQAHRILTPAFGMLPVADMLGGMKDIASQMILKWARLGEENHILLTDEFTKLTLDTIALCSMEYRFNSFYTETLHPFVEALNGYLATSQKMSTRPKIVTQLMGSSASAERDEYLDVMRRVAAEVMERRRQNPVDRMDFLSTLLYGKDPKTGQVMRDDLIAVNMVNFLVAGHETTSGLLSFAFMYLLKNPKAYLKAQKEVDEVLGTDSIEPAHFKKLKYINAILRETLRLTPTAPVLSKHIPKSRENEYVTICDGKYHIENDDFVRVMLIRAQSDPRWFGEDADTFRPERMHEDGPDFARLMKAWKPFGNGSRSCIGQHFAWQEAVLVMAIMLQNFDITFVDPNYRMAFKQNLTIKPKDLYVKVRIRESLTAEALNQRLQGGAPEVTTKSTANGTAVHGDAAQKTPLQIFYGSNAGTCQALAQKLASSASKSGVPVTVRELDAAVGNLSTDQPAIIIVSSYEGQPPDNAARFVTWIESSAPKLSGVKYAVFGCGHKDWQETLHRVPKLVDEMMERHGATRLLPFEGSDVSKGTVLDDFEEWQNKVFKQFLPELSKDEQPAKAGLAEIATDQRSSRLSSGLALGKVMSVKTLTADGQPEKRHMEIELPPDSVYEAGDYLAVLPLNPDALIRRIMSHWNLPRDATITLRSAAFGLPTDIPLSIHDLLSGFFELSQPASKGNINDARSYTQDEATRTRLDNLLKDETALEKIRSENHTSLFDLLQQNKETKMPFDIFLSNLLPLHVRQYSISSSPMTNPGSCTITYSVVKHWANLKMDTQEARDYIHEGVASTYLSTLSPGDVIQMAVKRTATANLPCAFRLPNATQQASTPLLMFCAGTGLAPFRGFIQQRVHMLTENPDIKLAPALLFIGCRTSKGDRLYAEELDEWQKLGAVDVRYAFSQEPEHPLAAGCRYVPERMIRDIEEIRPLWRDQGARVFTCGSRRLQDGIRQALLKFAAQLAKQENWDEARREQADRVFRGSLAQRAVSDIFD